MEMMLPETRSPLIERLVREFARGVRGTAEPILDPVELADACGITDLDLWQRNLLTSTASQQIMLCSRQSGKSLCAAIKSLHVAISEPGSLTLVVAPAMRQAQELFGKVKSLLSALGPRTPALRRESALALTLVSGSRIVVIPGEERTVRGFSSVRLLCVDEAARVPDALYQSLRPMLAVSQGSLVALSTPFGRRGWFFQEWETGTDWERVKVTASECPRIDPAWLAAERERIGEWWYRQEYLCEFVQTNDSLFNEPDIRAAFSTDIQPLFAEGETL
jgi:hypothetical protein